MLCEVDSTPPVDCGSINYEFFTADFVDNELVDVNAKSRAARCTEIGYYYDLKCKKGAASMCEDAACDGLQMYTDDKLYASIEFCKGLDKCVVDTDKCKDFEVAEVGNFQFEQLSNTGLSLTQIAEKCDNIGYYLDFDHYNFRLHNFYDEGGDNAKNVCIETIVFDSERDLKKCQIMGALQGKVTKISSTTGNCVEESDSDIDCSEVSFTLPVFYGGIDNTKDQKINVNPHYDHDSLSVKFGEYLCDKVGCARGYYKGTADGMYACENTTTTTTTTTPDGGYATRQLTTVGLIVALV